MKLKPPTNQDNPKPKKNTKKRKFEDDQSTPKINKIFLSVDPEKMSKKSKITKPRKDGTIRCTDSTTGQHSKPVGRDDAISPDPDGAGRVTCEISDHVGPDLANKLK